MIAAGLSSSNACECEAQHTLQFGAEHADFTCCPVLHKIEQLGRKVAGMSNTKVPAHLGFATANLVLQIIVELFRPVYDVLCTSSACIEVREGSIVCFPMQIFGFYNHSCILS